MTELSELARLFVGVKAVGTWDELFFICTCLVILRRHFPLWQTNLLQAVIFVSFLLELGYSSWGPLLTVPFALPAHCGSSIRCPLRPVLQGYIFARTRSLTH